MSNISILKGVVLVGLGATSYGMLATFVKLAYQEGYTTAEVTSAQFIYGIIGIVLLIFFQKKTAAKPINLPSQKNKRQLILAGTSLGLTSVFYYLCVKYIDVSIAIVMLMQSVWIGVVLEWILDRKRPSNRKLFAVLIVLIGTVMATNIVTNSVAIDWRGIFFGLLAASSFTTTMYTANKIAVGTSNLHRSLYMLYGGAIIVFAFALLTQNTTFNLDIFLKWGLLLALFGTIIPPILMNAGFPSTGIGLGSIVSSLELPVSVLMAYFILQEKVILLQWIGIFLILFAIIIMNIKQKKSN